MPVSGIKSKEKIIIEVDYMEDLIYIDGRYQFLIPLRFGNGIIPEGVSLQNIVNIKCAINCLNPGMQYGSTSHTLVLTKCENLRCHLIAQPLPQNSTNSVDFHLGYRVQTNVISAALLCDMPSEYSYDQSGSFVCFVNPCAEVDGIFPKDIIFLLDRSGSMTGEPMSNAIKGLKFAINTLKEHDRFGIIAYDHEQSYFLGGEGEGMNTQQEINQPPEQTPLFNANDYIKKLSHQFLDRHSARGGTDIRTPVMWSLNVLNQSFNNNPNRIPFVLLITDGAVYDEKEIVKQAQEEAKVVRLLTFGIGKHCNYYFLKMLSSLTSGWNEGSIYSEDIEFKMKLMMDRASIPILTNVKLEVPEKQIEFFPKTVPDLFAGGPITLSGKFEGAFPQESFLTGQLGNGEILKIPVRTDVSEIVPVNRVFLKQRIDQLTADYWLTEDEKIKKQIVDVSVNERFPSPYTSMIAYELTPKEKEKIDKKNTKEEKKNKDKNKDDQNKDKNKKKSVAAGKGKGLSSGQIAALAGGVVVLGAVGAGAYMIGNAGLTMANVPGIPTGAADGLFDSLSNACACDGVCEVLSCGSLDCGDCANMLSCGGCGDCDQCIDNLPCASCNTCDQLPGCNICTDISDGIGNLFEPCIDNCGNICGDACSTIFETIEGCTDSIGDIVGSICQTCSDCNILETFGECGNSCSGIIGSCGDSCSGIFDSLGGLCSGGCDALSGIGECLGGICDGIGDLL